MGTDTHLGLLECTGLSNERKFSQSSTWTAGHVSVLLENACRKGHSEHKEGGYNVTRIELRKSIWLTETGSYSKIN